MVLIQLGKDLFHDGFPKEGGAGLYAEEGAVLIDCREFMVIEEKDMAVSAKKRRPLLLEILGIHPGYDFFPCHTGCKYKLFLRKSQGIKVFPRNCTLPIQGNHHGKGREIKGPEGGVGLLGI